MPELRRLVPAYISFKTLHRRYALRGLPLLPTLPLRNPLEKYVKFADYMFYAEIAVK